MKSPWTILFYILLASLKPVRAENQRDNRVTLPDLTGKYGVGTTAVPLIDSSRLETITEEIPNDLREVMVQIWYPTDNNAPGDTLPYLDSSTENFLVEKDSFPSGFFSNIKTHALKDIPAASGGEKFPVLLFSPGLGCIYQLYQSFIEDIVSHGYIVAGINHPYFANITCFPDGHWMQYGFDTLDNPAEKFNVVVEDAKFVITKLKKINDSTSSHILFERMNLENIGMYGHSFGGAAAIETAIQANEVKAGINIDGTLFGTSHLNQFSNPIYIVLNENHNSDFTIDSAWHNLNGDGYIAIIKKSRHFSFMDLILYPKNILPGRYFQEIGTIDSITLIQFTLKSIIAFFDCYLKNSPRDSIINIATQYTEVTLELSNSIGIIDKKTITGTLGAFIHTNYPNPFDNETTIFFNLPGYQKAVLTIFNFKGQEISTIDITNMRCFKWRPQDNAGGIYIYTITVNNYSESKIMILRN